LLTNLFNASKKYKQSLLQKRPLHLILIGVRKCNMRLRQQKFLLLLGYADRTAYNTKPASDFESLKESNFPE